MAVDESGQAFTHPIYNLMEQMPGISLGLTTADKLLTWGASNSLFVFPMATSCCGIEFMAAAFDDAKLLQVAYGYEQLSKLRKLPTTTPSLPGESFTY